MERLGTTGLAGLDNSRGMTDGTTVWYDKCAYRINYLDDFWNNLVGLDDADTGTSSPDAQALTLTDVTQRGTFDGSALQLYGFEDGNG